MRISTLLLLTLAFGWSFRGGLLSAQETRTFKVVVNAANPASSITSEQLSEMFLRRRLSWPHGETALPVDQPPKSPVREAFSEAALDRPARAVAAYWQQQIFSGRGVPPVELASDDAVTDYVRTHRGAVGYVSADAGTNGLKVLEVTR
jgi:hypothetical protein